MAESAICVRLAAQASTIPRGNWSAVADMYLRRMPKRVPAVVMGDIGEEITEIELEPLPEEVPAVAPAEPAVDPVPA